MNAKVWIIAAVVLLLVVGGVYYASKNNNSSSLGSSTGSSSVDTISDAPASESVVINDEDPISQAPLIDSP